MRGSSGHRDHGRARDIVDVGMSLVHEFQTILVDLLASRPAHEETQQLCHLVRADACRSGHHATLPTLATIALLIEAVLAKDHSHICEAPQTLVHESLFDHARNSVLLLNLLREMLF